MQLNAVLSAQKVQFRVSVYMTIHERVWFDFLKKSFYTSQNTENRFKKSCQQIGKAYGV